MGAVVYSNSGIIFTQYWLLNYVNKCPSGWNTYQSHCWRNASNATSVPVQNITNLKELSVTGKASQNGQDIAIMTVGSTAYTESNPDSALNLAAGWKLAEFNVFGDCCSSQANSMPDRPLSSARRSAAAQPMPPPVRARALPARPTISSYRARAPWWAEAAPAIRVHRESRRESHVMLCLQRWLYEYGWP